jgi:hypothetical protein
MNWLDNFLSSNKASEVLYDYKGQMSFGRVGAFLCLFFSQAMACAGFFYSGNDKMLSYCSTISLQFLGAAVSLYIPSKATETFSKKWAPEISCTVAKIAGQVPQPDPKAPETQKAEPVAETVDPAGSGKATDD